MSNFLSGYGTYIVAAIAALGAFLINLGLVTSENWEKMIAILIPLALATIRRAIARTKAEVVAKVEVVEAKVAQVAPVVANVVAAKVASEVKAVVQDAAPAFPHRYDTSHIPRP